jgi:nucleoside-diphosphate-sugar epimerase
MTGDGVIAVTGASGFIGGALVQRLEAQEPLRVLVRRGDARSRAWEKRGVHVVIGDLADPEALARLVRGARTVIHGAAFMGKSDATRSHVVNVKGTERLAGAAAAAGVERFVYLSSISVFAATRASHDTITEATTPDHVGRLNHYSRTKYLGERALRRIEAERGLPVTVLRPTNVYGPESGPWFHQWVRLLERLPVAFGDVAVDVVHVDDVVAAITRAAGEPACAGGVFHIGHEMVTLRRFMLEVAHVTGYPVRELPPSLDRPLRELIDRGYRLFTGRHLSLSLRRAVEYPHVQAWRTFGYEPRVSFAEGFAHVARWWRARDEAAAPTVGAYA